jgi:hypothetical protein
MSRIPATSARATGSVNARPPKRFVVFDHKREPMALHCPVMELAPVPGRPMLPVRRARSMMAWARRVPSWLWLTPMVHQNDTRFPEAMVSAMSSRASTGRPVAALTRSGVKASTWAAKPSNPSVEAATNSLSTAPQAMSRWASP